VSLRILAPRLMCIPATATTRAVYHGTCFLHRTKAHWNLGDLEASVLYYRNVLHYLCALVSSFCQLKLLFSFRRPSASCELWSQFSAALRSANHQSRSCDALQCIGQSAFF
jgi:hypothetical protein